MHSTGGKHLLSVKQVLWIWLPLAATWILMAGEGPLANALVARMEEAKTNLAALGVAIAFTMLFESPMLLILSASITLVVSGADYRRLRKFTIVASACLSVLLAVSFSPTVFALISRSVLDLPDDVASNARLAGYFCLPIPLSVAYRRFYQGLLIKHRRAAMVAVGTAIRFLTMAFFAFTFYLTDALPGASSGALALSLGMLAEAVVVAVFAMPVVKHLETVHLDRPALSYPEILKFYLPLAANSVIFMALQPLLTFFLAHSVRPVDSLAVFPVVWGCMFFFVAQGISLQEVVLSQLGNNYENIHPLKTFTWRLAQVLAILLLLIFFSPFDQVLYTSIMGLSPDLSALASPAGRILAIMPFLTLIGAWLRALHMHHRKTIPITVSSLLEVLTAAGTMWIMLWFTSTAGVLLAPFSLALGRIVALGWLWKSNSILGNAKGG